MEKISDDYLAELMNDSKKIIAAEDKKINESSINKNVVPQNTTMDSSNTKKYLMEQIESMEQQINHIKSIIGRM